MSPFKLKSSSTIGSFSTLALARIFFASSKVMPSEENIKTEGSIVNIVTGVIRGETASHDKLDEIIRKVKLALGDA